MHFIGKLGTVLAFVGLPLMASADVTDELQQRMVEGVDEECQDHARIQADAEWAAIERGGRTGDFSSNFKDKLFQVEKSRCILTQQILILEMLREEFVAEDEWISMGGPESLQLLREKLISTFPQ